MRYTQSASVRPRGATKPLIRWRIGPPKMLIGTMNMILQVELFAVPLILLAKDLNILLRRVLVHVSKPQVEACERISKELSQRNLL